MLKVLVLRTSWPNGKPAYGTVVLNEHDEVVVGLDPEAWGDTPEEALHQLQAEHPELAVDLDGAKVTVEGEPPLPPPGPELRHE